MPSLNNPEVKALIIGSLTTSNLLNGETTYAIHTEFNTTVEPNITRLLDIPLNGVFSDFDNHSNGTLVDDLLKRDHVFDRADVRAIFTVIYSLVFCCCFFGEYKFFSQHS